MIDTTRRNWSVFEQDPDGEWSLLCLTHFHRDAVAIAKREAEAGGKFVVRKFKPAMSPGGEHRGEAKVEGGSAPLA